jgi:hypothetical protein
MHLFNFSHLFSAAMGSANGKVLLLMGKCPSHAPDTNFLRNAEVTFLHASCTSRLEVLIAVEYTQWWHKYQEALVPSATVATERKDQLELNATHAIHMIMASC